jgi:hypothetical protein
MYSVHQLLVSLLYVLANFTSIGCKINGGDMTFFPSQGNTYGGKSKRMWQASGDDLYIKA